MRKLILLVCMAALAVVVAGCREDEEAAQAPLGETGGDTVAAVTLKNSDTSKLAQSLKSAEMLEMLQEKGPYTVFAPTDSAFDQLPAGTLEMLMKSENKESLQRILKFHVVEGSYTADKLAQMGKIKTESGDAVSLNMKDDQLMVGEARVTRADIQCSNGYIHLIDMVMLPPAALEGEEDILDTAEDMDKFETFLEAADETDLADMLEEKGPYTVFMPTDAAFDQLPEGTLESLMEDENLPQLAGILKFHIVRGAYPAGKLKEQKSLQTLAGESLTFKEDKQAMMVQDAVILQPDIMCKNGIIHVINRVMMPEVVKKPKAGN